MFPSRRDSLSLSSAVFTLTFGLTLAAHAEPAPSGAGATLPAVTVNARGRPEAAQQVPIPLTSIDGETLEAQQSYRLDDLQQWLPSTSITFGDPRQSAIAVRGVGKNPSNDGLEGSTGVYLDNVYLGRAGMATFDLLDIERVDLLRGPQGTLFGKNTTAGVLALHSRPPTWETERSLQLSIGQRGLAQGQAVFSGALSEDTAGRLLVYGTHERGTIENLYDGGRVNGGDRSGLRGQWLLRRGDGFSLRVIADQHRERSTYGTRVIYALGGGPAAARARAGGATGIVNDPRRYAVNTDGVERVDLDQGGMSAEANWKLGSGATLTSITAGRSWKFAPTTNDNLNIPVLIDGGTRVRQQQFSQELRYAGPTGGAVDHVVGAFYMRQRMRNEISTVFGPQADIVLQGTRVPVLANASTLSFGALDTESFALFSQATWHATSRLDLTAGLRVTQERKDGRTHRGDSTGGAAATAFLRNRPIVLGAYDTGPLAIRQTRPSALLNASYRLDDDAIGYVSASHGERSGGINLAGPGAAPGPLGAASLIIGPERVDSLDVGVKSSLWNDRLTLNVNAFLAGVRGYQTSMFVPAGAGAGNYVEILTNAGDLRSQGLELDASARPVRGLTVWTNAAFNDARYRRYDDAPCPSERAFVPNARCSLTGRQVAGAPRWTFNAGAEYRRPVGPSTQHFVSAAYAWRSAQDGTLDGSVYSRIAAYGLIHLATGWKVARGNEAWSLSFWLRNALDKKYFPTVAATANGAYVASVGTPRTLGMTVRLDY
ncbi:MAG: TonB-dependent receptor [Variovorax sp.]|nr:MAG: TonB-dependent receptor [Variovorax sp.]